MFRSLFICALCVLNMTFTACGGGAPRVAVASLLTGQSRVDGWCRLCLAGQ